MPHDMKKPMMSEKDMAKMMKERRMKGKAKKAKRGKKGKKGGFSFGQY